MSPIPIAGPAVEPVSLAEMKTYLRLDTSDEDAVVASLIVAARHTLELATRRAFVAQTWRVRLDRWPEGRAVPLPFAPVMSIVSVRVTPSGGSPATIAPGSYRLDTAHEPPRLIVDDSAPEAGGQGESVEIDASFGFGPAPADVPAPLRLAIQRLAARWFERRGDEDGEADILPGDVRALVWPFIRRRIA